MPDSDHEKLQARLGYQFTRPELLARALTHSSAVIEPGAGPFSNNERFEFLGDAVLDLLASEYLLESFPDWTEGQLSKSRSKLVNARTLESAARALDIGPHLTLGRGEEKTGGREKSAILADAFEAIVGAIYLDSGLDAARQLLSRILFQQAVAERGERMADSDRKSALQEFLQQRGSSPAEYRLAQELGPDHEKQFVVEAWAGGELLGTGEGRTKKQAEQRAASSALERLERAEEAGSQGK